MLFFEEDDLNINVNLDEIIEKSFIYENIRNSKDINFKIPNIFKKYGKDIFNKFDIKIFDMDRACQGKLILYETEGYILPHIDGHKNLSVLIIFPEPKYDGGILKLYIKDDEYSFKSSDKYQIIIFRPDILHEVTKITDGKRLVFKSNIIC